MLRTSTIVLASVVATIAFFLACSDDGDVPIDAADAAECECPAAEPPLAGRLTIVRVTRENQGGTPGDVLVSASCPDNAELLGGGCEADNLSVTLWSNGVRPPAGPFAYGCRWNNPNGVVTTISAWASCLAPAP